MNLFFFTFCRLNILNTLSDIFHFCMSSKSYPPAAVEFMLNIKLFEMIKYFIITHTFVNYCGSNIVVVIKENKLLTLWIIRITCNALIMAWASWGIRSWFCCGSSNCCCGCSSSGSFLHQLFQIKPYSFNHWLSSSEVQPTLPHPWVLVIYGTPSISSNNVGVEDDFVFDLIGPKA